MSERGARSGRMSLATDSAMASAVQAGDSETFTMECPERAEFCRSGMTYVACLAICQSSLYARAPTTPIGDAVSCFLNDLLLLCGEHCSSPNERAASGIARGRGGWGEGEAGRLRVPASAIQGARRLSALTSSKNPMTPRTISIGTTMSMAVSAEMNLE